MTKEFDLAVVENQALLEPHEFSDPGAFTFWGVTLVFNVVFIIQHQVKRERVYSARKLNTMNLSSSSTRYEEKRSK